VHRGTYPGRNQQFEPLSSGKSTGLWPRRDRRIGVYSNQIFFFKCSPAWLSSHSPLFFAFFSFAFFFLAFDDFDYKLSSSLLSSDPSSSLSAGTSPFLASRKVTFRFPPALRVLMALSYEISGVILFTISGVIFQPTGLYFVLFF
jgi:hypothetical protein